MVSKFTGHLGVKFNAKWREWSRDKQYEAIQEVVDLFQRPENEVVLRGAYLTQGFRADTDLLLWMYADRFEAIQDLQLALRKSAFGEAVVTPWAFAGIALEAEFNKAHLPAFVKGVPPKQYICFYPYSRTADWYTLPPEERASLLKEHGMLGREFPDVLTNGVNAFGLGDHDWLLSFETDDLQQLVRLVRRQREAKSRVFTEHEGPFIVGRRFELAEALAALV